MKKILVITAIALFSVMAFSPVAFASSHSSSTGSTSTDYTVYPMSYAVQVSPDTVIPAAVPLCKTSGGLYLVCYTPTFIRTAYNYPTNLDGTGQTIVIVDAFGSPTIQNDLASFDSLFGIPAPPSFTILCPTGGCPAFSPNNSHDPVGWAFETSLDVEYAHAMAPGANIVLAVASTNSGNAINTIEAQAISLYPGSIMSQSFGTPEFLINGNSAQLAQAQGNYATAQAEGITVFASAGDWGATNCFSASASCVSFANAAFPASSPLNTAVGGTQGYPYLDPTTPASCPKNKVCNIGLATVHGPCTSSRPALGTPQCTPVGYGGEQVWNEPFFGFGACTGGAPSLFFGAPSYQQGLSYTDTSGTTSTVTMRTTADVSYNAAINGGVLVFTSFLGANIIFIVGGTSAGSPQWAAIGALANQAAGHSLGFLNNAIYKIAHGPNYSKDFHDITIGNDQETGTPVGFNAVTGWDPASGWGTPNVANLIPDLVANA